MNAILKIGKFFICLSITYALLALYAHTAINTGVLQTMTQDSVDAQTIIFSIAASIPLGVVLFWTPVVRHREIYPMGVMLNRWRVAAFSAIFCLVALQVLL